jgi:tellurite methyltransferase
MIKTLLIFISFQSLLWAQQQNVDPKRYELLSGIRTSKDEKGMWDKHYSEQKYVYGKSPAKFLSHNHHYLKPVSTVLDMGMGEGRNAVFLAHKGHKVLGIDISSVAVKKARMLAREFDVRIKAVVADLSKYKIAKGSLDAIVSFYYVDRTLHRRMTSWLKPGGILIYEAHTINQKKTPGNESYNKRYMLKPNELLNMFDNMIVLKYEEPLHVGEYTASIILQKRKEE